jgi:hypothetical protein
LSLAAPEQTEFRKAGILLWQKVVAVDEESELRWLDCYRIASTAREHLMPIFFDIMTQSSVEETHAEDLSETAAMYATNAVHNVFGNAPTELFHQFVHPPVNAAVESDR